MVMWIKALAAKPTDLSLILGTPRAKDESQFLTVIL